MPRPRPLSNVVTGRPYPTDSQSLTPRTPHSRAGRAEEALGEIELEQIEDDTDYRTYAQQQAEPLLASSASDSFPSSGYRSRGDDHREKENSPSQHMWSIICQHIPLIFGGIVAAILFILIIFSIKWPETLNRIISHNATSKPLPSSHAVDLNIISYENYTKFPLLATEYRAECYKLNHGFMHHADYWDKPPSGIHDVTHIEEGQDHRLFEGERTEVCTSTITYMLDGHIGLLADLALLAQAAALARERNRTFLIDDTYWNRGRWTDHFQDVRARQPGPEPGCRAPPPEELVACPRLARHWVINSRTAKFHFGDSFFNAYENPYAIELNRRKPIYQSAHTSFSNAIRPNALNAALIRSAREEFSKTISSAKTPKGSSTQQYFGVHLRRGDRKPQSWEFHGNYVPISDYVQAVEDAWRRLIATKGPRYVYLASDSPMAQNDLIDSFNADVKVFSLARSEDPNLRMLASPGEYVQNEFAELDIGERISATRGMIVDFALLNGMWKWNDDIAPAATICTASSNICRVSAIGLGWERAFGHVPASGSIDEKAKGWIDIDQKDAISPFWEPFELFS